MSVVHQKTFENSGIASVIHELAIDTRAVVVDETADK